MAIRFAFLIVFGIAQCKGLDLSCEDIRTFVDGHNSRRLLLAQGKVAKQPPAAVMNSMVWDEELAAKASKWASQHKFSHNPVRSIDSGRFTTGENIYWSYSTDPNYKLDFDRSMNSWFNEYKQYKYGPLRTSDFSSSSKPIGHYTQMAWSDSTYVGCGVSGVLKDGNKHYYVVCNYGPSGNYLGEVPYKSSDSGSGELVCGSDDCSQPYGSSCSA